MNFKFVLSLASACAATAYGIGERAALTDSDVPENARQLAGSAFRDEAADPPTLRATVTLSIGGSADDRPDYQFGAVGGLTFDAKGQIYVADAMENKIRVYSDKGAYLFAIGQKGSGPEDFLSPSNISIANDGTLWVRDNGNHRFSVLRPNAPHGTLVRAIPMASTVGDRDRIHWDAKGHVVSLQLIPARGADPMRIVRVFLDEKGSVTATDTAPKISPDSVEYWVIDLGDGGISRNTKPLGMRRLYTYGGTGMAAFATNTVYAVNLVNAQGARVALLKRNVALNKPSPKELKMVEDLRLNTAKNYKLPPATLKLEVPKFKPVIADMGFDMDGRLWVVRDVADGSPNEADIYSSAGKWVGIMQWPTGIHMMYTAVKGNTGLGLKIDDDGVQQVVRLAWK